MGEQVGAVGTEAVRPVNIDRTLDKVGPCFRVMPTNGCKPSTISVEGTDRTSLACLVEGHVYSVHSPFLIGRRDRTPADEVWRRRAR
jgi:hypothetical protein